MFKVGGIKDHSKLRIKNPTNSRIIILQNPSLVSRVNIHIHNFSSPIQYLQIFNTPLGTNFFKFHILTFLILFFNFFFFLLISHDYLLLLYYIVVISTLIISLLIKITLQSTNYTCDFVILHFYTLLY